MAEALFFSYTNIDRSCIQPGSRNTMCPLYTENADSIIWTTQYDLTHLHSLFMIMAQCGSLCLFTKKFYSVARCFKNTFLCGEDWLKDRCTYVCMYVCIYKRKPKHFHFTILASADTHPEQLTNSVRKERTFGFFFGLCLEQ